MRSRITATKAQALVEKFEQDYVRLCSKIELAAKNGKKRNNCR